MISTLQKISQNTMLKKVTYEHCRVLKMNDGLVKHRIKSYNFNIVCCNRKEYKK